MRNCTARSCNVNVSKKRNAYLLFIIAVIILFCNSRRSDTTCYLHDVDKDIKRRCIWRSIHSSTINSPRVNLSSVREQSGTNQYCRGYQPLHPSVVDGVKVFAFFIGIGRSGHSIVASILDSHPHVVISNELNLFKMLNTTSHPTNKSFIFNEIWNKSCTQATTSLKDPSKGYTLAVDGLYQGSYVSHIDVIGDKMGGSTIALYLSNPSRFEDHFNKLRSLLDMPIKVFHVIRNPFDNIATKCLHIALKLNYTEFAAVKKDNITISVDHRIIDKQIVQYFQFYEATKVVKHKFKLDTMELHSDELITNAKVIIKNMCEFLTVHCSDDYLNITSHKVFNDESKTRYNIKWNNDQILLVKKNIKKFEALHRYLDFNI